MKKYKNIMFSNSLFRVFIFICSKKVAFPQDISSGLRISPQAISDKLRCLRDTKLVIKKPLVPNKSARIKKLAYEIEFGKVVREMIDLQSEFITFRKWDDHVTSLAFEKARHSELLEKIFREWLEKKSEDMITDGYYNFKSRNDTCLFRLFFDDFVSDIYRAYPKFRDRKDLAELKEYFATLSKCALNNNAADSAFEKALK